MVPVKVKHKDSNFVYSTFTILDNCSQGCFVKASLMKTSITALEPVRVTPSRNYGLYAMKNVLRCCIVGSISYRTQSEGKILWQENDQGKIHCFLLIGKSVSPLKYISIPRLELIAVTLSVKVSFLLIQELGILINKEYFWTDSKVVLG